MKQKSDRPRPNGKEGGEPATKADVAAVKADVVAVKSELKADVAAVKSELKSDIAALRSEMATNVDMAVMKLEFKIDDSIKAAKEELIEHMDKLVNHVDAVFGDVKTTREEQVIIAQRSYEHTDRIDDHDKRIGKLEAKVGGRAG